MQAAVQHEVGTAAAVAAAADCTQQQEHLEQMQGRWPVDLATAAVAAAAAEEMHTSDRW